MPGSLVLTMKVALEKGEGLRSSASDESELYLIRPAQLQKCSFYLFWLRAFQTCCLLVNPAFLSDLEFDTLLDTFLLHKYNPQCRFFKEFLLLAVAHEKLHLGNLLVKLRCEELLWMCQGRRWKHAFWSKWRYKDKYICFHKSKGGYVSLRCQLLY